MHIEVTEGKITITLTHKEAEAVAIPIRFAVDAQGEIDPDDIGVEPELVEMGVTLAEQIDRKFEELGFHAFALDHNDDPDDEDPDDEQEGD